MRWSVADLLTVLRIPMALAFILVPDRDVRLALLALAALTDSLDGPIARRWGASSTGHVLDPVADKLFTAAAFGVVAFSGRLEPLLVLGVLLRDIVATGAFITVIAQGKPRSIPARLGGKLVTLAQLLTLLAFLVESPYLTQFAWATAGMAVYSIWDYARSAAADEREL